MGRAVATVPRGTAVACVACTTNIGSVHTRLEQPERIREETTRNHDALSDAGDLSSNGYAIR